MKNKYHIHSLEKAEKDIDDIVSYLSQKSEIATRNFIENLEKKQNLLLQNPHMGSLPHDAHLAGQGYRYVVIDPFLLFYKVMENMIAIYRVIHSAQDYHRILL